MGVTMTGKSLRAVFDKDRNSLNAIRLFFATAVIVSHSWAVGVFGLEPAAGATTVGFWAVLGFFGISGFLITRSRLSGQSPFKYYRARFLRIFPGFIVCILLVAFVLSPLSLLLDRDGSWNLGSAVKYVISNAAFYPPHFSQEGIAGTLGSVPYETMWNGSLWTLFWEAVCYVAVGVAASILPRKVLPPMALTLFVACAGLRAGHEVDLVDLPTLATRVLSLVAAFAAGAALFFYQDKVKVNALTISAAALVLLVSVPLGMGQSLGSLPFVFLVLLAGFTKPLAKVGSKHDISYGMYIYAWPVQQFVMLVLGDSATLPVVIILSVVGTIPLAFLSFILIEKPANDWGKRRTVKPARPSPEPSVVG